MDDETTLLEAAELEFDWVKVCLSRAIPFAELMGLKDADFVLDNQLDRMIIQLQSFVLADHLEPSIVEATKIVRVPKFATWWDHFKFTYIELFKYWPMWKLFKEPQFEYEEIPVKLKVEVQPTHIFPEADIPRPPVIGRHFKIYTTTVKEE